MSEEVVNEQIDKSPMNESIFNKFIKFHEKKIHLLVLELATAFGSLFLILHFVYIGHFPELNFAVASSIVTTIAITGSTLIFYLIITIVVPHFALSKFLDGDNGGIIIKEFNKAGENALNELKLGTFFFAPILVTFICVCLLSYFCLSNYDYYGFTTILVSVILSLLFGSSAYYFLYIKLWGLQKLSSKVIAFYLLVLYISFFTYLFTPYWIYIFYISKYNPTSIKEPIHTLVAVTVICVFVSIIHILFFSNFKKTHQLLRPKNIIEFVGFGGLILLIIIALSDSWFSIPQIVLRIYGLADIRNVSISFKKEDCEKLKQFDVKLLSESESNNCRINHSTILSAIGSDYYIETEEKKRFAVPKSNAFVIELPVKLFKVKMAKTYNIENHLKKIELEISNQNTNNFDQNLKASIILFYIDEKGVLSKKKVLETNYEIKSTNSPFKYEEHLSEPKIPNLCENLETLETTKDIWCDVEVFLNGRQQWYEFENNIILEPMPTPSPTPN